VFQQLIFAADQEVPPLAAQQQLGLQTRQQTVAHQSMRELLSALGRMRIDGQALREFVEGGAIDDAALSSQAQ